MLTTNHFIFKTIATLYGPYRKRYPQYLNIQCAEGLKKISAIEAESGIDLSGNGSLKVTLAGTKIRISAPVRSKIETFSTARFKTLLDGTKIMMTNQVAQQELECSSDDLIRITVEGQKSITIGLVEDRPSLTSGLKPTKKGLISLISMLRSTLESSILHAIMITLLFFANSINIFDLLQNPDLAKLEAKKEVEMTEVVPIELAKTEETDFNGRSLSPNPGSSASKEMSEQKANQITNKLNNLIGRISGIRMPNINGDMIVSAVSKDGGSHALQARLAQGKNAAVSGNLKMLTSGKAGDSMRWQIYSTVGREISLKDQEQVVELFKSLAASFRACYDNALLKDEDLSVTVHYEGMVSGEGRLSSPRYSVVGKSTPQSENDLTSCITNVLNKGKVSKNLSGVTIKQEFIFKS